MTEKNLSARKEIERVVHLTERKIGQAQTRLKGIAVSESEVKMLIANYDALKKDLLKSLDELGGPVPVPPKPTSKSSES